MRELLLAGRRKTLEVIFSSGLDDAPILDDIIDTAGTLVNAALSLQVVA